MNKYGEIAGNAYRIAELLGWQRNKQFYHIFDKEQIQIYDTEIIDLYGTFELIDIVFEINFKWIEPFAIIINESDVFVKEFVTPAQYFYNTKEELILALQKAIIFCYENKEKENAL